MCPHRAGWSSMPGGLCLYPVTVALAVPQMTFQRFVYLYRGWMVAPPLVFALFWTRNMVGPAWQVWALGLLIFAAGLLGRIWAQQHLHFRLLDVHNALTHTGPYRWVRNPIYISNTLLFVGLTVLSQVLWLVPVTIVWCFIVYTIVVRDEEEKLLELYGAPYAEYLRETSRWLPRPSTRERRGFSGLLLPSLKAEAHNLLLLIPFIIKKLALG